MFKNICKNISIILNGKYSQKLLHHAKQSATDAFKTVSTKKTIKKQQNQLMNWFIIKLLIELRGFQKIPHRIIQKQLQMSMIKIPKERYISPEESSI